MMLKLKLVAWGVAIVILAGTASIGAAYWLFASDIRKDIEQLTSEAAPGSRTITAGMISGLPAPAQRYFAHANVVGTSIPRLAHLSQSGKIRAALDANWMSFQADEVYSIAPPAGARPSRRHLFRW
jgi:hypothetical protein